MSYYSKKRALGTDKEVNMGFGVKKCPVPTCEFMSNQQIMVEHKKRAHGTMWRRTYYNHQLKNKRYSRPVKTEQEEIPLTFACGLTNISVDKRISDNIRLCFFCKKLTRNR
jgi:hypothetical protein